MRKHGNDLSCPDPQRPTREENTRPNQALLADGTLLEALDGVDRTVLTSQAQAQPAPSYILPTNKRGQQFTYRDTSAVRSSKISSGSVVRSFEEIVLYAVSRQRDDERGRDDKLF